MEVQNIAGIARAAVLANLTISVYTGRKQDKRTSEEVAAAKNAGSNRAVSTYKSLFADSDELREITSQAAYIRTMHYKLTLPWEDMGPRLLPTAQLFDYQKKMGDAIEAFDNAVAKFLNRYDNLVSVAAFKLGDLFDRDEYPSRDELAHKFKVYVGFAPLPTSGDFRLDIESEVMDELAEKYEKAATERVNAAMNDAWNRLHETLTHMSEKLRERTKDEKQVRIHPTLVENALEVASLLSSLNITNDPALERARKSLEKALSNVDVEDLRESPELKAQTKEKVDAILDAYNWEA